MAYHCRMTPELYEKANEITESLAALPCSKPFICPVNPELDPSLRNYFKIIKEPMNFMEIQARILTQRYEYITDWYHDFLLIVRNAKQFNGPESSISQLAECMKKKFEKKYYESFAMPPSVWYGKIGDLTYKLNKAISKMPQFMQSNSLICSTLMQFLPPNPPANQPRVISKKQNQRPSFIPSPIEPVFYQLRDDNDTDDLTSYELHAGYNYNSNNMNNNIVYSQEDNDDFWEQFNMYMFDQMEDPTETSPELSSTTSPDGFSVGVNEYGSNSPSHQNSFENQSSSISNKRNQNNNSNIPINDNEIENLESNNNIGIKNRKSKKNNRNIKNNSPDNQIQENQQQQQQQQQQQPSVHVHKPVGRPPKRKRIDDNEAEFTLSSSYTSSSNSHSNSSSKKQPKLKEQMAAAPRKLRKNKKQKDTDYVAPSTPQKKNKKKKFSFSEIEDNFESDAPAELTDSDYFTFMEAANQLNGPDDQKEMAALIHKCEPELNVFGEAYPAIDIMCLRPETIAMLISFTKQKLKERSKNYPTV
ncbi:hypothetical protein TRFO_04800 [Tritrichomonas foetus]|uniref:Bromo domain-containing protein n=1 Tax=Tritrichomonas foetus TaxID=1144522 RepID=A0A1J4KG11_9EUKA|nr:hypothetical protein TRFO_04800 [Tritrichomonas foetus]|eukprot:OHT08716.1 hypothetical protein TRFO_04800 [Tritrichomonas foetus]